VALFVVYLIGMASCSVFAGLIAWLEGCFEQAQRHLS